MKALVVDPDRNARSVVKRLLSHVNVEVVEAENGLVALSALEQFDPDFVVLEIDMPILSGHDCLAAIRQSPVRPDIPVICISNSGTRDAVTRMVTLGVADFLLKPINPVEVLPRIKNLLVRVAQWRQRQTTRSISSMLIVDHDPNFLAFAKPLLENEFEVLETTSSTAAAITFRDAHPKPSLMCLAEGLPLMSEDLLLDVIRKIAVESGTNPPQFFLLAKSAEIPAEKAARFAGVVRKTFVPQAFVDEFRRVVLREQNLYERLRHVVREGLRDELVTATQQTIGVMIGSEISVVPADDTAPVPGGVQAAIELSDPTGAVLLDTVIASGRREVETMGSQIVRREITFEEGGSEVLGELANTISGRMRACLLSRGFDLRMGLPAVQANAESAGSAAADAASEPGAEGQPDSGPDLVAQFRCATGEMFSVALSVRAGANGLSVGAPPTEKLDAAAEPAESGASADDVLF